MHRKGGLFSAAAQLLYHESVVGPIRGTAAHCALQANFLPVDCFAKASADSMRADGGKYADVNQSFGSNSPVGELRSNVLHIRYLKRQREISNPTRNENEFSSYVFWQRKINI